MSAPTWFCNKCGKVGEAASRADAEKQHTLRSPTCDYLPSWNWPRAPKPADDRPEIDRAQPHRHTHGGIL